ncbi:MAG: T9SS type A sorting domain-containing protein, partial [Bacteroidetes bacterium]|nr:T9SS type A sorting domain-containing protein [Bacteroidota bacterium]
HRIWYSDSAADGASYINMTGPGFPMYTSASAFAWSSTGRMYIGTRGTPPNTGLYYIDGQVNANSTFTPVPAVYINITKMHWDAEGYLWIYGGGTLARSDSVLTAPGTVTGVPMPVELVSFSAVRDGELIRLHWSTAGERENYGFAVERSPLSTGSSNEVWETRGFVQGKGSTNAPQRYTFTDKEGGGRVRYRLKQIDRDGGYRYSPTVEVSGNLKPGGMMLEQNYPNPFNPATTITFRIPQEGRTTLTLFDMIGRETTVLVNEVLSPGMHSVQFNGSTYATGIYVAILAAGGTRHTIRMHLVK